MTTVQAVAPAPQEAGVDQADRLERLITQQFTRSVALVVISVGLFFALYVGLTLVYRAPSYESLLRQMEASNENLAELSSSLLTARGASDEIGEQALRAAVAQADLHQQAIEELERQEQQLGPEGLSLLQLVGGAVVVALIGFLGLQRLQNLDVELQGLRESTVREIETRTGQQEAVLESKLGRLLETKIGEAAQEQVKQTRQALGQRAAELDLRFTETTEALDQRTAEFSDATQQATAAFQAEAARVQHQLEELHGRYKWLEEPEMRLAADEIARLVSVEQAHNAAERFRMAKDNGSARLALRQIVERHLPGNADEFHNAQIEASRMDDPLLGLDILEEALRQFEDNWDLMADKAKLLISVGRPKAARQLLEDWKERKPDEFFRGWRPPVFYADAVQALDLTDTVVAKLESTLEDAIRWQPRQAKIWSTYARLVYGRGDLDRAVALLRRGLEHNPLSQELHFQLGEFLLQTGNVEEAQEQLELAFRNDYQSEFQHDVRQPVIRARLAQAYEAAGNRDEARLLYLSIAQSDSADAEDGPYMRYAQERLRAIGLQDTLDHMKSGTPLAQILAAFADDAPDPNPESDTSSGDEPDRED